MTEMASKKLTERKFIRRPWIQTVLLSGNLENPVPKKAKARVTWLDLQKNRDGTHSGEITDNVYKINVVFSEEAVVECLEDRAHGHIFKHFTDILGGAVVLTDYKVVPQFSEQVGKNTRVENSWYNCSLLDTSVSLSSSTSW